MIFLTRGGEIYANRRGRVFAWSDTPAGQKAAENELKSRLGSKYTARQEWALETVDARYLLKNCISHPKTFNELFYNALTARGWDMEESEIANIIEAYDEANSTGEKAEV